MTGPVAAQAAQLQRIRGNRVKPERDLTMRSQLDSQLRQIRQIERSAVNAAQAWDRLLEQAGLQANLLARTKVVSFRFGVLTVRASDASTKYAVDRFLRAGGENALARLASTTLRRVKLIL